MIRASARKRANRACCQIEPPIALSSVSMIRSICVHGYENDQVHRYRQVTAAIKG
jgi:hypothetical protein